MWAVSGSEQTTMWTAIVCTCQNRESADSFQKELLIRQQKGLLTPGALLLAVDDPRPNIGSGSAALNALICVAECLAARGGQKVVTADALYNARILILLLGSTFPFSPCGHGFMPDAQEPHPGEEEGGFEHTEVKMNIDRLMEILNKLCQNTPPGVWVSSTDMILKFPNGLHPLDLTGFEDSIGALTILATPEHAMLHGACRTNENGEFAQIIHLGGEELLKSFIRPDGLCEMLTGVVYLSPKAAETLLTLHTIPPMDACTYIGLDLGARPLSLSLFFDILLCLTAEITEEDYIGGQVKPSKKRARALLWKMLRGIKMRAVPLPGVEHQYLRHVAADVLARYHGGKQGGDARVINSLIAPDSSIGSGSVLINCNLQSPIKVGSNCFLSGLTNSFLELQGSGLLALPVSIPDNLTVQEIQVCTGRGRRRDKHCVVTIYGVNDNLTVPYTSPSATFCNQPWSEFFQRTGIQPSELWLPGTFPGGQTLQAARLFVASHPFTEVGLQETFWLAGASCNQDCLYRWRSAWRVSLADILRCVDCDAEFTIMRDISFELQCQQMQRALQENKPVCFLPFFRDSLKEKREFDVLRTLDEVVKEETSPLLVCRVYACIADVLGYMAEVGGIRGGPAANVAWRTAFTLIEKGELVAATKALAAERSNWIKGGSDRIIRASRHYERAGQILTRKSVLTAKTFVSGAPCTPPAIGQPVTVTAPARIDLAGGWTDTPPQAFEWGGAVATMAITINNEYPIKTVVERIPELKLELLTCSRDGVVGKTECTELSHLADYFQPHAPGALLKAAFICANVVEFPSSTSLSEQLRTKFGCGFKVCSTSNVPQGSGLGTSSILGATILAAIWRAAGQEHSRDSLIHAVLYLEQLLTTGGGWQDQCGGMYGGVKLSQSKKGLPVHITTRQIKPPTGFLETVTKHLLLIYIGKTRLARNLLQDVLRNWHSRDAKIVQTMKDLVENAYRVASAFEEGDLAEVGACMTRFNEHKMVMAPGSMPKVASLFVEKVQQYIHGFCFTGAGGGGFMAFILKESGHRNTIHELINSTSELQDFVVYGAAIDEKGIQYSM